MTVFQRKVSTSSVTSAKAAASSKPVPARTKSTSSFKSSKSPRPSLVQRVSSSVKPKPKPQPSLLRRATSGLSEVSTTRWEKRILKRLEKFPKDHPLLVKAVGAGLCMIGAGAGAITIPGVAAALGLKLAVAGGTVTAAGLGSMVTTAGMGAAAQGTAVAGVLAAGAKLLASSVAMDIGGRLMAAAEDRPQGWLSKIRRKRNAEDATTLLPLVKSSKGVQSA